jgi:hypothetical protein
MSLDNGERSPQEVLESIEELLFKIERHMAPPPLWQRALKFGFQHLFTILILLSLAYFTWQIWDVISAVLNNVESIRTGLSQMGTSLSEQAEGLKFWK